MQQWSKIIYRGFYDVPRAVIAISGGITYFFYSRFDENLDNYLEHYEVWRLPCLSEEQIKASWVDFASLALKKLPNIALRDLPFAFARRSGSDLDATLLTSGAP